MEIIPFTDATSVTVDYNEARRNKYGRLPSLEVWISRTLSEAEGEGDFQVWPDIQADQLPSPTNFVINIAGPASGYIKLKN